MTKLIVDAGTFQQLLAKHPEIEVELVKNGAAQIAEQFKKRVLGEKEKLVEAAIAEVNSRLNYKYHLPEPVLNVIRSAVDDRVKDMAERYADKIVRDAVDSAIKRHADALEKKIEGMATSLVEKKVAAVFAAAAKMR